MEENKEPEYMFAVKFVRLLTFLTDSIDKQPIESRYDSGKISGKVYHAGSSGDAYLQGRDSVLIYLRYMIKEFKLKIPDEAKTKHGIK